MPKKDAKGAKKKSIEFMEVLSEHVADVIKCKNKTRVYVLIREVAKLLYRQQLVEDDYSFFTFSFKYLPQAFIKTAFPYPRPKYFKVKD